MAIIYKKTRIAGFTLIDTIVGLAIISMFSLFYLQINQLMNQQKTIKYEQLIRVRKNYEKQFSK